MRAPDPSSRPLLRYLGGKWRMAPWIISHFPEHRIYVEPFGGAASVLLCKPLAKIEIYNDVDDELVNLFRVLRSPAGSELVRLAALTPYALTEYHEAWQACDDPLERARRLLIRSHMGHGTRGTRIDRVAPGFGRDGKKATTRVAGEWGEFPASLRAIIERLAGAQIDCRPAEQLIAESDDPRALLYLDPPYLPETRSTKAKSGEGYHTYRHEMTLEEHEALLQLACASRAMVIISAYPAPTYAAALAGWTLSRKTVRAHRNIARMEELWLNPAATAACPQRNLL